jgi:ribosome biogenesis GTPase
LETLGWNAHFAGLFEGFTASGLLPARVARQDRGGYVVYTAGRAHRATVRGALRFAAASKVELPAVGDWVAVSLARADSEATIDAVLPRRSVIQRGAAGSRTGAQVIAANVDVLLICCGLDRDFNLRRIERYLTVAYSGGVAPVVLLTKSDACNLVVQRVAETESVAMGVPVLAVSAVDGCGLDHVRSLAWPGRSAALVGSSGVGKSTLINALLGGHAMRTAAVRSDGRGRHTTTHRQLLLIPGGGVIVDTPGMRELQLWGDEEDAVGAFADIAALAAGCRFRDCSHVGEPGCAVRIAADTGEIDASRLASYHKLQRELRWLETKEDPAAAAEQRARWRALHRAARAWYRDKHRR